jgi:maltose O-acetyltransferase
VKQLVKAVLFSAPLRRVFGAMFVYLRRCDRENYAARVRARYAIHPTVTWDEGTLFTGAGTIEVGEHTYFGVNCHISSHPAGTRIQIGRGCAFAHSIHVRTTNYARVPDFREARNLPSDSADIVIGDYVWVGSHVYINAGLKIGNNVIIGANSVLTHDVKPDTVVGGVPARLLHHKSEYARPPGDPTEKGTRVGPGGGRHSPNGRS